MRFITLTIIQYQMEELNSWVEFLRKDLSEVVERDNSLGSIYISSLPTAQNLPILQENNIKSVLSAAKGVRLAQVSTHLKSHLVLQAQDQPYFDLSQFFDQSFTFIEEGRKHGNVLVHCMAGISRSATLVALYLMRKQGMKAADAVEMLKKKRQQINPNSGFLEQLDAQQKKLGITKQKVNTKSRVAQIISQYQKQDEVKMPKQKQSKKNNSTIFMVDELISKLPVPLVKPEQIKKQMPKEDEKNKKEQQRQDIKEVTTPVLKSQKKNVNQTPKTIDSCIQTQSIQTIPQSYVIERIRTEQDRSPPKQMLSSPKTPPFNEYSRGSPFDNVVVTNNSSFAGKIVSQKQRMSFSTALNRNERVKDSQGNAAFIKNQSSSVASSPNNSRAKSRTESKIQKLKASMVGLCKNKQYSQTIFNKLMENKTIYKNKLRLR